MYLSVFGVVWLQTSNNSVRSILEFMNRLLLFSTNSKKVLNRLAIIREMFFELNLIIIWLWNVLRFVFVFVFVEVK